MAKSLGGGRGPARLAIVGNYTARQTNFRGYTSAFAGVNMPARPSVLKLRHPKDAPRNLLIPLQPAAERAAASVQRQRRPRTPDAPSWLSEAAQEIWSETARSMIRAKYPAARIYSDRGRVLHAVLAIQSRPRALHGRETDTVAPLERGSCAHAQQRGTLARLNEGSPPSRG